MIDYKSPGFRATMRPDTLAALEKSERLSAIDAAAGLKRPSPEAWAAYREYVDLVRAHSRTEGIVDGIRMHPVQFPPLAAVAEQMAAHAKEGS